MFGDQMEITILILMLDTTCLSLELILLIRLRQEHNSANQESGLQFTTKLHFQTEGSSATQERNQQACQKHSLLELVKFSSVGISEFKNYTKEILLLLSVHLTLHGVVLSLRPLSEENQFHLTLTLTLNLKYKSAKELQFGLNMVLSQEPPLFNQ